MKIIPDKRTTMREFQTGATRDTEDGKIDYEGFLSPLVIDRFAEYMQKHRFQADGHIRDSDNWQKHFGDKHYDVCMKSLWRHFMDLWLEHRGKDSRDGIEDALCGILFNAEGYLYEIIKNK